MIHERERLNEAIWDRNSRGSGRLAVGVRWRNAAGGPLADGDLLFTAGGKSYALWTDVAPLLATLGEDYEYRESISCAYAGYDKTFDYGDVVVYTNPVEEKDSSTRSSCTPTGIPRPGASPWATR
jgi:hypothetical protein